MLCLKKGFSVRGSTFFVSDFIIFNEVWRDGSYLDLFLLLHVQETPSHSLLLHQIVPQPPLIRNSEQDLPLYWVQGLKVTSCAFFPFPTM